jgi:integrase
MADVFQVTRGGYRAAKGWKKSSQDKVLRREEFVALLEATRSDKRRYGRDAYDLFSLAGNFGLRQSEILSLDHDHFKPLAMGYFRVLTLKKRGHQEDRVYTGRDGQKLVSEILASRRVVTKSDILFPFGSRTARYLFAYYAEKAGISPNVSFHALRHTAARMMLQSLRKTELAAEAMNIVTCFLRHKPATTQIYTEPTAEEMIQAMNLKGVVR